MRMIAFGKTYVYLLRFVDSETVAVDEVGGNRLTATDASGAVTRYAYDAVNRLVSLTDTINATRPSPYPYAVGRLAVLGIFAIAA